jgi:hypothetical protein
MFSVQDVRFAKKAVASVDKCLAEKVGLFAEKVGHLQFADLSLAKLCFGRTDDVRSSIGVENVGQKTSSS